MIFKQISRCESSQNHKLRQSYYLSYNQKLNVTEIRGSTNSSILFDDTLFLVTNFSFKDEDIYHKLLNACSSFRRLMGTSWTTNTVTDGLGFKNASCPIPPIYYRSDFNQI
ncbi:Uncharacterized protein FWK35_00024228 [Aphis craccivora]|uniref:Uncharacterized protein n=1 Tax=Aphis craccivora TaxID=307492 RepID=A0A6G0Y1D4_APHCR|nr:Uncharacterized protein FWK35_00024228 [Aphis craccivora]